MVNFLCCSTFSYRSSNFTVAKVVELNLFALFFVYVDCFMASFILKSLAKKNGNLFAIVSKSGKSDNYRCRDSETFRESNQEKKQGAKNKSVRRSNREKL